MTEEQWLAQPDGAAAAGRCRGFQGSTLKMNIEARLSPAGREALASLQRKRQEVDRRGIVSALRECNSANAATAQSTHRFLWPVQQHGAGTDACGHG